MSKRPSVIPAADADQLTSEVLEGLANAEGTVAGLVL